MTARNFDFNDMQLTQKYLAEFEGVKGRSRAEEKSLITQAQKGDKRAESLLFKHNAKFVVSVALKFKNLGIPVSDLINEGNMGMVRAIGTYNLSSPFKFISYAVWWIRAYITRALIERASLVRVPANKRSYLAKSMKEVLYDVSKLSEEDQLLHKAIHPLSLDAPVNTEVGGITFGDTLVDESEAADQNFDRKRTRLVLEQVLETLEDREKDIVRGYFGVDTGECATLEALSQEYGLTRERVRQIKETALRKLRHPSRSKRLKEADLWNTNTTTTPSSSQQSSEQKSSASPAKKRRKPFLLRSKDGSILKSQRK